MPTFKPLIFKHQQKEDGTFNVKIRITHNRESKYLPTVLHIKEKQVSGKYEIKDRSILKKADEEIDVYWEIIKKLPDVSGLNVSELVDLLQKGKNNNKKIEIDFIAFSNGHIDAMIVNGGKKYAGSFRTTILSLCDFFGKNKVMITEINTKALVNYEKYLRSERTIIRTNQFGKEVEKVHEGMGNGALTYLTNIRTLFNAARFKYNDEDEGINIITHYPFRKFKIDKKAPSDKRSLKPETIKQIRGFMEEKRTRASLGRDVFMLSFYLVGMNIIDLYESKKLEDGRLIYNRSKTEDRRDDGALISIRIEPETSNLLEKYRDPSGKRVFCFYKLYGTSENFIAAVNKGLKKVALSLDLKLDLTTYYARHSWATIARNRCMIPKEDIIMALNHSNSHHKVTDAYLETDWSIIDRANRKVLNVIKEKRKINIEDPNFDLETEFPELVSELEQL